MAGLVERSVVNGPGIRAVLWVQGCPIHCKGCFNKKMWPYETAKNVGVEELACRIAGISGIEGVTFSGGEPFSQAEALAELGGILKSRGLSIVTFTGYTFEEIAQSSDIGWKRLLDVTDVLIAGPYVNDDVSNHTRLSHKKTVFLTDRYRIVGQYSKGYHEVELIIDAGGIITITGYPDDRLIKDL